MYIIEISLKLNPLPLIVHRKEQVDANALYQQVRQSMETGQPRLLELTCEQIDKKLTVITSEILALQIYEKTAASSGIKRPGFSF